MDVDVDEVMSKDDKHKHPGGVKENDCEYFRNFWELCVSRLIVKIVAIINTEIMECALYKIGTRILGYALVKSRKLICNPRLLG